MSAHPALISRARRRDARETRRFRQTRRKAIFSDPAGTVKSVVLTEEAQREAERLFAELFVGR
jgi:hypothetical protein